MSKNYAVETKNKVTNFYKVLGAIFIVIFSTITVCSLFLDKINF